MSAKGSSTDVAAGCAMAGVGLSCKAVTDPVCVRALLRLPRLTATDSYWFAAKGSPVPPSEPSAPGGQGNEGVFINRYECSGRTLAVQPLAAGGTPGAGSSHIMTRPIPSSRCGGGGASSRTSLLRTLKAPAFKERMRKKGGRKSLFSATHLSNHIVRRSKVGKMLLGIG